MATAGMTDPRPTFGAIVLAGGNARRLGGFSKGDVEINGTTMLTSVTDACQKAGVPADNIVVVGHAETELKRTVEDPPFSGPVAGIGAGLDHVDADRLFVLSCDIPFIASGLPRLIDTYQGEGVCFGGEKAQYLAGLYSSDALLNRIGLLQQEERGLIGMPVRKLMESLDVTILGEHEAARDLDTWEAVNEAREQASED